MKRELPDLPPLPDRIRRQLAEEFEERADQPLSANFREWALERWGVDLAGRYAGRKVRLPFGKASGQLSMTPQQVEADALAGLGFSVLKTVIAQDTSGDRGMAAWAIHETHMLVEQIADEDGTTGWTVTWKGRGWDKPFSSYLRLIRAAIPIGLQHDMPVSVSVKYHLPATSDEPFRESEYRYTTQAIAAAWRDAAGVGAPIIEKDFSPTLAADPRADDRANVLRWLREVPRLVANAGAGPIDLGMKLMNAQFDDDFQVEMLATLEDVPAVRFRVAFNRLFDVERGVAYGGPALARRNLGALDAFIAREGAPPADLCATGDIHSGRRMIQYALRGAQCGQLHTYFQLPRAAYRSASASRTAAALHELVVHPEQGLIAWILALGEMGWLERRDGVLHFLDISAQVPSQR
ncbi:MAG TPA: hypothetical protein VFB46_03520 [Gemmatimonadaceae bacterium]|nr:hypothetical protein [Gemmatimonadaceae bacterium]